METKIIISGFGGQGAILASGVLCYAALREEKHLTCFPSYGAEVRGGTARAQIIISDEFIGSPVVTQTDALIALNLLSYNAFAASVQPNGIILTNKDLYEPAPLSSVKILSIPALTLAKETGNALAANMIMLGVLAAVTKVVQCESLIAALPDMLVGKEKHIESNAHALQKGFAFAADIMKVPAYSN